jgi:hypothetical protein
MPQAGPGTTQVDPNCVPWDANIKEVGMKVTSEPTSAKNEVSQETLDQWQRKDNSRRAKTTVTTRRKTARELWRQEVTTDANIAAEPSIFQSHSDPAKTALYQALAVPS